MEKGTGYSLSDIAAVTGTKGNRNGRYVWRRWMVDYRSLLNSSLMADGAMALEEW